MFRRFGSRCSDNYQNYSVMCTAVSPGRFVFRNRAPVDGLEGMLYMEGMLKRQGN